MAAEARVRDATGPGSWIGSAARVCRALLLAACITSAVATVRADAAEPVRIALLPIVVHSSDRPDYLREGLADMMAARLEQVSGLDVVRIEDPDRATTRINPALAVGRDASADFVIFGAFTRFGEGASLDMQCVSTREGGSERPLREIFVHSGNIGDVIPDLDALVGKIVRFVIQDFEERRGVTPALARSESAESRADFEALRRRVEELEQALGEIQAAPAPAAVGATTAESSTEEASVR